MQNYIQTLALSSAVVCVLFDKMAAVAFMTQIIANHHKKSKTIFILAIYKRISVLSLTLLPSAKHGAHVVWFSGERRHGGVLEKYGEATSSRFACTSTLQKCEKGTLDARQR